MLANFNVDIKEFGSLENWKTDNSERIIKDLKLIYTMSHKVKVFKQILKYQDYGKQFKT